MCPLGVVALRVYLMGRAPLTPGRPPGGRRSRRAAWLAVLSRSVMSHSCDPVSLKLMSIQSLMPSKHLILCRPLLLHLQSFPASGSSPLSQVFTSGGQSSGASASVPPMSIQGWSPLGWTGWISLQSKRLSRVFSNNSSKASILSEIRV